MNALRLSIKKEDGRPTLRLYRDMSIVLSIFSFPHGLHGYVVIDGVIGRPDDFSGGNLNFITCSMTAIAAEATLGILLRGFDFARRPSVESL